MHTLSEKVHVTGPLFHIFLTLQTLILSDYARTAKCGPHWRRRASCTATRTCTGAAAACTTFSASSTRRNCGESARACVRVGLSVRVCVCVVRLTQPLDVAGVLGSLVRVADLVGDDRRRQGADGDVVQRDVFDLGRDVLCVVGEPLEQLEAVLCRAGRRRNVVRGEQHLCQHDDGHGRGRTDAEAARRVRHRVDHRRHVRAAGREQRARNAYRTYQIKSLT